MEFKVRLFATLRKDRGREMMVELGEEWTARAVIDQLKIDEKDVAILMINGRDGLLDTKLVEGDIISIFPPVGGG
ncbi:Molybdopterin synthase sulfur carrier subunit [Petrocella atlantisensis]|uniref:Molybdopterin synthase sulfur carrier subunit n=1 Tax=Petrocella atlantisensis TaxID=2173034 RepID=A0A3P7PQF0_9FIRM|nr:MoaD/ThiS family protein [Petrocella atlantisensis]MCF8018926.1 MoaD/ThiS family protein [Vallitaleaceae bacterium]VDN46617.1 Molybdopterin synthase sulfur carrier subunit [Petrocella atlantisensis]